MALCLVLFDDAALRKVLPQRLTRFVQHHVRDIKPGKIVSFAAGTFALLIVFANIVQIHAAFGGRLSAPAMRINDEIAPLRIVNTYGLFAVMTTAHNVVACFGEYDFVGLWDCPNEVAALKLEI
jgi:hypothetical protein